MSIGSETPDKADKMQEIIECLGELCEIVEISDIYSTPAAGGGPRPYLNAVAEIETNLPLEAFERNCKSIELLLGRDAASRACGDVPADIDVIIADGKVVRPRDYAQSYFRQGLAMLHHTQP